MRATNHLGGLLTRQAARAAIPRSQYQSLIDATRTWQEALAQQSVLATQEGAAPQLDLTDFQQEFAAYRKAVLAARAARGIAPPAKTAP